LEVPPNGEASQTYFYDIQTGKSQYERPPPGSKVTRYTDNSTYIEP
jgi:hypothetical protein